MVETVESRTDQPAAVFDRAPGELEIHELHPREAAIVRIDVPVAGMPAAVGDALGEVARRMGEAGVALAGPPFTRYLSFSPESIVAETGFPVLRPAPTVGRVQPATLPGGRIASMVHLGPYESISTTYDRLMASLAADGIEPAGPMWEVYWSDPEAEPDPATWRTEILVPLG